MSKNKITGKALSIQLGREESRILLVGKGFEILHGVAVPTPAGAVEDGLIRDPNAVQEMLKSALQAPEFKGVRQAVFTLCTSQVITTTATTPDLPKAKLEKLIEANADMYFQVDIRDYRLIWEVIGPKEGGDVKELLVQLWAVPVDMLRRYYNVANACGLSVAAVDYCGHSAATAVGATFARPVKTAKAAKAPKEPKEKKKIDWNAEITFGKKKKPVEPVQSEAEAEGPRQVPDTDLHILLDGELLGMTFVQAGQVVHQRFYRCGADPSYQFGEVAMMVEYFQTQKIGRGSEIHGFVSGPGSTDEMLVAQLVDMLGMALLPFQTAQDSRWFLCAGAVHTTLDFGNPSFNTAVHTQRNINTNLWQYGAILVCGAALVAVVLMLLNARLGWNSEITGLENQRNLLQVQAAQVSGFKENYTNYETEYAAYERDWDSLFDSLHTYNDNLVFVLEELEKVLPENTSVRDIVIDSDSVMISFACDDKEEAAYLIMSLRDMEYVDVNTISNLIGGGKGAATEYGTPIEEVTPPSEGGSLDENSAVATAAEESYSPSRSDLWTLETAYGKTPDTKEEHTGLADYKEKHTPTFEQRETALRALIGTNPFAANSFLSLMMEDFYRGDKAYVMGYFLQDAKGQQLVGQIFSGNVPGDYESAQTFLNDALDILTKDETNLSGTEALLCAGDDPAFDPVVTYDMETAYVHYLEVAAGLRSAQEYPYLDAAKVAGGIDTGKPALDTWLNAQLEGYTFPEPESSVCNGCHEHSDANADNYCDTCGGIIDDTACTHPVASRYAYTPNADTATHTYICGVEGCGMTITEDCTDVAEPRCYCDFCGAEKHDIVLKQLDGTRTHAQACKNCEKAGDAEPCTDSDGNELCDVCGGSVAFTRDEIEILEHTHGQVPEPTGEIPGDYESYKDYMANKHPTYFEREAAIVNLFCENAFAANDYFEDIARIFGYEDKIEVTNEFKSIQNVLDKVGQLLEINSVDDNEQKLAEIEKMIFAYDSSSGKYNIKTAYLYYLESAMSGKKVEDSHLLGKDQGNMIDVEDPERVLDTWEYVKNQNGITSSRADYEDILYNYLISSADKKAIRNKIGSEMVADLDKYFEGADAVWKDKYEAAFQLSATDSNLRKLLKIGFLLNYYEDPYREYDVLDALVTEYRNGKTAYDTELLLILQLSEREAGITKDNEQDENIQTNKEEIDKLKKELESLKQSAADKEEAAAGGSSGSSVVGDTRVFLDIGLLYTDELWDQELQRKGLDRDAKLPKLELEVAG